MKSNEKIVVPLTGGFGNQMFQVANALKVSKFNLEKIEFDLELGRPKSIDSINPVSLPTLLGFRDTQTIILKSSKVYSKLFGYCLRSGFKPNKLEKIKLFQKCLEVFAFLLFWFRYRRVLKIFISKDLGWTKDIEFQDHGIFIGYFQSEAPLLEIQIRKFFQGKRYAESGKLKELIETAQLDKPTVIHVRRGDYNKENLLGILGLDYYEKVVSTQKDIKESNVWIFSDDQSVAKELAELLRTHISPRNTIKYFGQSELSNLETFELMRYGTAYILANSSFGWWAANLSYYRKVKVFAPTPWFRFEKIPKKLIPKNWELFEAKWQDEREIEI